MSRPAVLQPRNEPDAIIMGARDCRTAVSVVVRTHFNDCDQFVGDGAYGGDNPRPRLVGGVSPRRRDWDIAYKGLMERVEAGAEGYCLFFSVA